MNLIFICAETIATISCQPHLLSVVHFNIVLDIHDDLRFAIIFVRKEYPSYSLTSWKEDKDRLLRFAQCLDELHEKGIAPQNIEDKDIVITDAGDLFLWNAPFLASKEGNPLPSFLQYIQAIAPMYMQKSLPKVQRTAQLFEQSKAYTLVVLVVFAILAGAIVLLGYV